jgi:hypothetical protein
LVPKRHDLGLGPCYKITLKAARDRVIDLQRDLLARKDPLAEQARKRQEQEIERAKAMTMQAATEGYINDFRAKWNKGSEHQFTASMTAYVYPVIGSLPVAAIDKTLVLKVIKPIWATKMVTANRVRSRIEAVLTYFFDPLFFERVPLTDLDKGGSRRILVVADGSQAREAIKHCVGQLVHLGRRYVLAETVRPNTFHPKLIVRLSAKGGRIWLGSGNLTYAGWGGNCEVASAWPIGPQELDKGAWLRPLLDRAARATRSASCSAELEKVYDLAPTPDQPLGPCAVARLADACNVGGDPEGVRHKLAVLRRHCDVVQRDYDEIEKTNIISMLLARDEAAVAAKRERLSARGPLRGLVGTPSEAVDLIGQYQDAGVQLFINSDYRNDMETHELMASDVIPHFA